MQAISKISYQYAMLLQENGVAQRAFKGRMQVGADADITIFDPEPDAAIHRESGLVQVTFCRHAGLGGRPRGAAVNMTP